MLKRVRNTKCFSSHIFNTFSHSEKINSLQFVFSTRIDVSTETLRVFAQRLLDVT